MIPMGDSSKIFKYDTVAAAVLIVCLLRLQTTVFSKNWCAVYQSKTIL